MMSRLASLAFIAAFVAWTVAAAGPASASPPAQSASPSAVIPGPDGSAAPAQSGAEGASGDAVARYRALVDRLKSADLSVDFAELREAYTQTPDYRATMMGFYQQMWRPLGAGDFPAALKVAESVLERNYVEVNAHMVAFFALQQLGNPARAAHHKVVSDGLLRVIMAGGDGKTAETAWAVIDVSEEYAVMRALNVSPKSQGLQMNPNGPSLDILRVIDNGTKEERTLYFNVDRSMAAMTRLK